MIADDMRRVCGLTWVGWLNFCVLQWLWLRLHYVVETDGPRIGEVTGYGIRAMRPLKMWYPGWWLDWRMALPLSLSLPVVALTVVATLYLR